MIELSGVEKQYTTDGTKTKVLKGIDLAVEKGEFMAIMGASGAGKTTLMNILGLLDSPSGGNYRFEGQDVTHLPDRVLSHLRNHSIGFVFQLFHLLDRLTVLDNVLLPLLYSQEYPEDATERARHLVELVGLRDRVKYKPTALSGGQQQRVALARVLLSDASVLLLDEPFTGLEPEFRLKLSGEVVKWSQSHRAPVVLVTHDLEEAQSFGTLLGVIDSGRLLQIGDPHLTVRRPASIRAASLLGYRNILPARILGINASWCAIHPQTIIPPEGAAQAALHFQATVLDNRPQGLGWTVTVALAEGHCLVGQLPRPLAVGTTVVLGMPPPPAYDQAERLLPAPA